MKVKVAPSAGFCMGVRKAMDKVLDVSRGNEITYTLGPLIHNPQALKKLETRNVFIAREIDEDLKDRTVVIRAHGVPPCVIDELREVGANIVNATCPKVGRSQGTIRKFMRRGYDIVIVGDRGHAEIDSLEGFSSNTAVVVENLEEAKALPRFDKVCVVAQTTLNIDLYHEIADEVCRHADECHIADTVCASTERRQADVRMLAEETDATVVVGGSISANTKRLAEISRELGQPTFLIEDVSELNLEELSRFDEIGVTAGASTPNWVIQEVVDTIGGYTPVPRFTLWGVLMGLLYVAVEGNFFVCAGAAAFTLAMTLMMGLPLYTRFPLVSFFYLYPLHAFNRYLEIRLRNGSSDVQPPLVRLYRRVFLGIAFTMALLTLGIAWREGVPVFAIVTVSYLFGGLYTYRILPPEWKIKFKSLRDIPGSKDILIAAAWMFATVILPAIHHGTYPGHVLIFASLYAFTLVFSRATIIAIGGVQSDKLVGLETVPILLGRDTTIRILYVGNGFLALATVAFALMGLLPQNASIMAAPFLYMMLMIQTVSSQGGFFRPRHQVLLDAVFYIAGGLAVLFL